MSMCVYIYITEETHISELWPVNYIFSNRTLQQYARRQFVLKLLYI